MTAAEACTLLADTMCALSNARADAHAYRLVAAAGIHHAHALQLENQRLRRQLAHLRDEVRRLRSEYHVNTGVNQQRAAA